MLLVMENYDIYGIFYLGNGPQTESEGIDYAIEYATQAEAAVLNTPDRHSYVMGSCYGHCFASLVEMTIVFVDGDTLHNTFRKWVNSEGEDRVEQIEECDDGEIYPPCNFAIGYGFCAWPEETLYQLNQCVGFDECDVIEELLSDDAFVDYEIAATQILDEESSTEEDGALEL